jgi:hypothetical protein
MSDPRRLLEETGDELEHAMLRSVRGDSVSRQGRQRILTGLGISAAALTTSVGAASSLAAAKSSSLFKGTGLVIAKWIAVGSVVGLVPAGVWVARTHSNASNVQLTAPSENAGRAKHREPVIDPPAALAVPTEDVATPLAVPTGTARTRESKPGVSQVARPAQPAGLSDEVAALQVARSALADRDPNAALAALDRYKSRFSSGRLGPEATVLRIEALVQRGDRAQATSLADRFESSNPKSPYAERIRSILHQAGGAAKEPGSR